MNAITNLTEARAINQATGNSFFLTRTLLFLAQVQAIQGSLREAIKICEMASRAPLQSSAEELQNVPLNETLAWPSSSRNCKSVPQIDEIAIGMATLLYEQNELDTSEEYLQYSMTLDQEEGNVLNITCAKITLAHILQIRGEKKQASLLRQQATELVRRQHIVTTTIIPSIEAALAKLALVQGDLETAVHWSKDLQHRKQSLPSPAYLHEVNGIMRARISLAQGNYAESLTQLSQLYTKAVAAKHMRNALEILILQARGEQALGRTASACSFLERAIQLAEPEGYIRLFLDEGDAMGTLLAHFSKKCRNVSGFVHTLLAAFSLEKAHSNLRSIAPQPHYKRGQLLLEPLTMREREVLQLVAGGAPNQQIAVQLIVTESTIKRHLHNIFGKLGVSNRTQAIARARELELL